MAGNMDLLDSMLDLTRRLPPMNIEENVSSLVELCPDYADELLGSVDQPLKLRSDRAAGRDYLICDYNRDGESYRCILINTTCFGNLRLRVFKIALVERVRSSPR